MISTPIIWLLLVSIALLGGVAVYVKRYSDVPVVRSFIWIMWICAAWIFVYVLNITALNFDWINEFHSLGLALISCGLLATAFRIHTLRIRNTFLIALGFFVPFASSLLYIFGITPIKGFDPTPIAFVIAGALFAWALPRYGAFDIASLARNTVMENMDDIFIALDIHGNIVDFNRIAQTSLALSPPAIGASTATLSQPWVEVFLRYADTSSCKEEIVISNHIYELIISPVQGEQARILGKIFLFHDITRRRRAQADERKQRVLAEALHDTAEALSSTLDYDRVLDKILMNVGRVVPTDSANIALLEDHGRLHYVRFYGYEKHKVSEDELEKVGVSLDSSPIYKRVYETGEPLIIPDTHADPEWIVTVSGAWIRSFAIMPIRVKEKVIGFLNLDSEMPGLYTLEHIHNLRAFADQTAIAVENARLFSAADREIMERKQAEEKLQQLSRAVEQSPASIVITDTSGRIEYVNPRFTQVTGYSAEEAIGKNPRILKTDKTSPETYRQLWETIASGREWRGEFVNRKKNGELYYESATISPVIDARGTITHYLAVKEDITERKRNDIKLQTQNDRLTTLHNITLDLLNRHKVEDVLDAILLRASDLLEAPFGLLTLLEEGEHVVRATTEMTAALIGVRADSENTHLSSLAIKTRQPQIIQDYSQWSKRLRIHDPYRLKAVADVPILVNEVAIGVIALGRVQSGLPYTDEEIQVMGSFAQLAALALDNAQLLSTAQNELAEKIRAEQDLRNANQILQFQLEAIESLQAELREQAIRDPLTGLYNRRYLNEFLEHELARAAREGYPVSFIMVDIDHFKKVNDAFGHQAGDTALQKLSTILVSQTRVGDIVCRYGGEEFLAVLPNVTPQFGFQIAERWRVLSQQPKALLDVEEPQVTISCGVSSFPVDGRTNAEVISVADKALYRSKSKGRNCVSSSPESSIIS